MSKRLYEIARDLDLSSTELSKRIDGLVLSFEIQNHLSVLHEEQVDELVQALSSAEPTERVEKVVKTGVIRRRVRRRAATEEEAPAEARPVEAESAPEAADPAVAPAPAVELDTPEPSERPRFDTVVTRPEAPATPEVAEPEPSEAPVEASDPAPRTRIATVVTRDEPAVVVEEAPAPAPEAPASDAPRSRFATVVTNQTGAVGQTNAPSANELAALGQREADARASARGAGAKVVGTMNPDLLNIRLEADRKEFGPRRAVPGAPVEGGEKRGKKGRKRVVQSRDLYDKMRRGRGRKGAKSSGPTQTTKITQAAEHKRVVKMEESIIVSDLAHQMGIKAGEIAMKLMFDLGIKGANINTAIDHETAQLVAEIYEYRVEQVGFDLTKYLPKVEATADDLAQRPPVVTVMGHVDHGKTSLLDAIRGGGVAAGEAGGITQHIGAYRVALDAGTLCFLDTPGHEAFTALRARGAVATDIVILVVAADDGVMPQTVEAINHAKDASVPVIVAVNKCDRDNANPERVRQALSEYELIPEDWGGSTIFVNVSALTHDGIDQLLEMIHLQAEVMELKEHFDRPAEGLVIESKLDVGRGPVATVLVQTGTLTPGDTVVVGEFFGRVRTMNDEHNELTTSASPSVPVEITGLNGVPPAGERFYVVNDVEDAKTIAEHIARQNRQSELALSVAATGGVDAIGAFMRSGEVKELKVIVKGDVQGSVEAVGGALQKLSTDKVTVKLIHAAVGGITESDVNLAASSEEGVRVAVVGFNVRPDTRAHSLAEQLSVQVITHSVIYEIIDDVKRAMTGMLEPVFNEESVGRAEVRATFSVPKIGMVAGCMVVEGQVTRHGRCRLQRGGAVLIDSVIGSLRHFEKNVQEVKSGFECGLSIEKFDDVQVGDVVECYKLVETAATL